jgi:hypothetical protein
MVDRRAGMMTGSGFTKNRRLGALARPHMRF